MLCLQQPCSASAGCNSTCFVQVEVCKEQVEWATKEKRTFLRQRIEARLANLHLNAKDYSAALALISRLLTEVLACLRPSLQTGLHQHRHGAMQKAH